jgi:hypothetical protein
MVMPGLSPNLSRGPAIFRCLGRGRPVRNGLFGEAGISLLEVLFGAAIVAITAVGVAAMFGTSHSLVQSGGTNRIAIYLAQQRLEQVRAAGFGMPSLPDPREETGAQGVTIDNFGDAPAVADFKRRTVITAVCPTNFTASCPGPPVEAKLVTVMVRKVEILSPNNTDPQTQPVILQTVIVRP